MGARRSDRRRTAIALPRGNRRPRSATTVLLSFALLAALSTPIGARGLAVRSGVPGVSKSPSGAASAAAASSAATPGTSVTGALASAARRPALLPQPRPQNVTPKRVAAALDREAVAATTSFAVVAAPPDVGSAAVASNLIDEGSTATFLTFASDSSRTRGQPVSDC